MVRDLAPAPGAGLPRILVVDVGFREHGGMRVLVDLAARWHRAGAETEFFVMHTVDGEATELAEQARQLLPVRYGSRARGRLRWLLPAVLMRFVRSARRADLLVSVSEIGSGLLLSAAAAKLLGKPLAVVVHTPISKALEEWVPRQLHEAARIALRSADLLICVAQGCVPNLLAIGVEQSRIRVVHNGMDVERVQRAGAASEPSPVEPGHPLVMSMGRLVPQKGFDLLLRAHAELLRQGVLHHLAIAGEGPERAALERLIEELGSGAWVRLLGFRDNPHALIKRADLFCMSSRYEGFPLTLIEVLALGVPIVCTDCISGPSELLSDGEYGDLVAPESVPALVAAIGSYLRDPARLRTIARRGPERARSFDPDAAAIAYLLLFNEVIA